MEGRRPLSACSVLSGISHPSSVCVSEGYRCNIVGSIIVAYRELVYHCGV